MRLPQTAIAWTVELNKPKYNEVNETTGTCENFASNPILTKRVLGPDSVKLSSLSKMYSVAIFVADEPAQIHLPR